MKKYSKILKESGLVILAAAFIVSGFFAPQQAFAAATVTPATNGANVSIDTTSAGGSGTYKTLSGPGINELVAGDISTGVHTITLPAGWEFEISTISISTFGSDIVFQSTSITPSPTSFSFNVTAQSTTGGIVGFGGLKVRPTGITPSTGNMIYSGAGIAGVDGSTNFGTLSTVAGTVTKLAFFVQPGNAVYGSLLNPQPAVKTQDQFGNNSVKDLAASKTVTLTLTYGTGALQGTASLDIGTGVATPGTVTFTNLKVGGVGAVGTKQLTATATDLTSAVSNNFEITPKTLTATVTVNNKPYDGNNSAVITGVTLNGVETGDDVTVSNQGTATFASPNANTGIVVTSNGVTITGTHAGNYSFNNTATGTANIASMEITITPTTGQTKVYGQPDPTFAYTFIPALISPDAFTGVLSRVAGKNVGTYAYTIGDLSAGSNYSLALDLGTFAITQRTLNVTATGVNKVYNSNTTATVNLSDDRIDGDVITLGYTAAFINKNIGISKTVNITGVSITGGTDASNYILGVVPTVTTANITPKPLTVSFTTDVNKTYNGNATAPITGRTLNGVIGAEVVDVTGGSATFADKNIGTGKTVTATGFTLTGADSGNYTIGAINTTTGNVNPRPITITAVTDSKTYNGTTASVAIPTITSTFSPPIAVGDVANFAQAYNNKNVGTGKTLTPSGIVNDGNNGANYSYTFETNLTGVITTKAINVTAQTDTKVYDGTSTSSVVPIVGALETGDSIGTAPTQSYNTKDVGTGKTLIASGLIITDGNGGANYNITYVNNTAGVITAKGLTVSGATTNSKIYDGDINATVSFTSAALNGVVTGEEALVSLNSTSYSATFNNKNVGTGKTVTVSGLALAGTGASNYSLTQPVLTDGVISAKTLTVSATGVNKTYDASLSATVTLSDDKVSGDALTLGYTATFANKNVGNNKPISVSAISITGGIDAGNYTLGNTTAATTANITPATLTATITASNKVYDGNTSATILTRTLVGVLSTDVVTPNADGTATFADATVNNNKVVTATGITIAGADIGNYAYNGTATGTGNILPIPTVVYVDDNWAGTTLGADPDGANPATAFGYDAFATIQDGISKVAVGGTINVAAGSYIEGLTINKSLTLQGAGSSLVTVTGNQTVTVSNVTLDGFTFNGTVAINDSSAVVSGGTISNNIITGSGDGIRLGSGVGQGIDHITIRDNQITGNSGKGILFYNAGDYAAQHISYITINNNQITNNNSSGISTYGLGPNTITNNTVSNNNGNGISIKYDNGDVVSGNIVTGNAAMGINMHQVTNTIVENNTVSGQVSDGVVTNFWGGPIIAGKGSAIYIHENSNGNTIRLNTLINNKIGVLINKESAGTDPVNNSINNNTIAGNTVYGVLNALVSPASPANAIRNWWGDSSGPAHTSNIGALGNAVSDNVNYRPWRVSNDLTLLVDETHPSVTISSTAGSLTNISPIPVTIIFTEPVTDFTADDIAVTNGTKGAFGSSGSTYTISVTPTGQGAVTVNIAANVAWDALGNYNTVATPFSIVYDTVAPTIVTLTKDHADLTVRDVDAVLITATFSKAMASTPTITIGSIVTAAPMIGSGTTWTYTWDVPTGHDGTATVTVAGSDLAGNAYVGGDTIGFTIDNIAPVVAITQPTADSRVNAAKVITFTDDSDLTPTVAECSVDNSNWHACTTGVITLGDLAEFAGLVQGTFTLYLRDTDVAGNPGTTNVSLVKDTVVPTVTDKSPSANAVGIDPNINITITFGEDMDASTINSTNITLKKDLVTVAAPVIYDSGTKIATINPTLTLDNNSTYTVTITTAVKDSAGNAISEVSWQFTTSASYSINLTQGWNLISLPVVPNNTAIATVLGAAGSSIESVYVYDPYNVSTNGGWQVYHPGSSGTSDPNFSTMTAGYGYWVNYTSVTGSTLVGAGNLILAGNNVPPSRTLKAGWNLIGYYQRENTTDASAAYALKHNLDTYRTMLIGYINTTKQITNLDASTAILNPGKGYWVLLKGIATDTYIYTIGDPDPSL